MRRLVLAAALLLGGCSAQTPAAFPPAGPSPPPGPALVRVFGTVVDFQTNTGVANANIKFYIAGLDATAGTAVTDKTGFYALSLPPGVYNPRINGNDVDSNRGTILPVGTEYPADYLVNGGDCVMFYGTVRDRGTGARIGGATIQFLGRSTQTGSDGSYRLELGCTRPPGFGTGTAFMTVSGAGYVTQSPYGNRREFVSAAGLQRLDVALQAAPASAASSR